MQEREPTILYVEDEKEASEELAHILRHRFPSLLTAKNGLMGLELYQQHHPDIVIIDICMPEMDGLAMAREIRQINPRAQIILTTAHSELDYMLQAIEIGVNQFVVKPVKTLKLTNAIERALEIVNLEKRLKVQREYLQYILDFQENLLLFGYRDKIYGCNRRLLVVLGFESIEEMVAHYQTLEAFAREELSLDLKDGFVWEELRETIHKAICSCCRDKQHIYQLRLGSFPSDKELFILSLTDVTSLEKQRQDLEHQANTDTLTGIYNRLKFNNLLKLEVARFGRYHNPMSLIMFDIDHFKHINDELGHQKGDDVLVRLTRLVSDKLRETDFFARWGGEEFMILAPETGLDGAVQIADKLRRMIAESDFGLDGRQVTCSFGVATLKEGEGFDDVVQHVDNALYAAKDKGRNRVETTTLS